MSRRTIQSPGVEIREIDLTQRPAAPVGTSVFIAGFANQGPVDEIFNVGTFAEFEEIYGKPTNAAERKLSHTTTQVFDSDANVLVSRLPYGAGDGTTTGDKYSALVYPVKAQATTTITSIGTDGNVGLAGGGGATGNGNLGDTTGSQPFIAEVVAKDGNDNLQYVTVSGQAYYSGSNYALLSAGTGDTGTNQLTSLSANAAGSELTILASAVISGAAPVADGGNTGEANGEYDYFLFGNPHNVELTQAEYNAAMNENITWSDTTFLASYDGTATKLGKAGLVVLNKTKFSVNNNFEGYYVASSDNSSLSPASNYDTVKSIKAVTGTGDKTPSAYTTVPTSRYSFPLSSTNTEDKGSVSKSLETLSKFDLDGGQFIDTLSIGLFKVRITPFANTDLELSNFLAEGFTGSLNAFAKTQNENGGSRKSFFLGDQDAGSPNVKILVNPKISKDLGDWTSTAGDAPTKFVRATGNHDNAQVAKKIIAGESAVVGFKEDAALQSVGNYSDVNNNSSKNTGSIPDKLDRVFNIASNVDLLPIDVTIEAGLGTIFGVSKTQTNSAYDDTAFVDVSDFATTNDNMTASSSTSATGIALRDNYRTIFNKFEAFAAATRKDHIFIADVLKPLVVQGSTGKVLDDKSKNFSQHVYWPLRHQFGTANSNFATVYGNWAKVYDGTSDSQIWIPFSGVAAKIYANNDANFAPWFAPAGFNRGVVTGVNDIAVSPTQRQRDQLYRIAVNPVTQFPAEGIVVFGQKTLQRKPTAFDRVNVRRLFLDLEKRTRETLKFFVFEPNTFLTRNRVVNTLTPIFENAKQTEGVYDYLIVCDERNNPASVIDQNELRVDIYLKPVRAAEFILVNFYAVNTDVNFEEIVGQ